MAQACNLVLEEAGGSKAAFATESVGSPHLKNQSKTRRAEVESEHTRAGFSRHPQRRGKETGTCHMLDEPADTATPLRRAQRDKCHATAPSQEHWELRNCCLRGIKSSLARQKNYPSGGCGDSWATMNHMVETAKMWSNYVYASNNTTGCIIRKVYSWVQGY